ncbi:hypothetical protein LOTGIDRAFT_220355 [Lottia gigantea]|uniref:ubiquitinyl hydrolase 1 n=1 Tax=Lottia gigantea TaxID=225164 RepID=V4BDL8_LOTGI|nr:hypothetical protein LOTGIDRAFT_220355 [Lottia gigantea]ESO86824.1 hypothetical protein LOTGIDRAFT_220355 [Lottia gigantea]
MAEADSGFNYDPTKNYDDQICAQQRDIEKQITDEQSLVSNILSFDVLKTEYQDDQVFQNKIQDIKSRYKHMRKTRGDGNCFFRAFGFAYLEHLLKDDSDFPRFKEVASKSKDELVSLGFPQFTIEDFHDTFMEVIDKVGNKISYEEFFQLYTDQGISDYFVVYLRLIVSGHLQKEEDFFMNFVEGGRTVKEFCNQEVEPMHKESDHIHITALTAALGVTIRVEYMDRGDSDKCNQHDFPDGSKPDIFLLYRPGHYDILYP